MGTSARFPGSGGGRPAPAPQAAMSPAQIEAARQELAANLEQVGKATNIAGLKSALSGIGQTLDSVLQQMGGQNGHQ